MTDYRLRPNLESTEQTLDRLRRAAEAAEIGTFYCPLPLGRLYWNARGKIHFWLDANTPDADIDIETFYRAIHPDDRERTRAAVELSIADGKPYDVEYRTVSPRGDVRWLRAKGSACFDDVGRPIRFDGITIDISEQKRLEAERDALMESERMQRRAAQSANEEKDAFVAAVSHEIRAPLTSILAWVELLDRASDDATFVRNGISVIRRSVMTQRRLVDDLVDVTRIRKGKFTVTRSLIAVTDCFNAALQEIRPIADEKGVFVADLVAEPLYVQGDGPRLQQVFGNLLNNALKHTEQGGKILPSLVETGDTVRIRIADTGAGIPPERLDEIFEPFVQVESTVNRECAGLGLGLAIARSIVLMHGGEIAAQSAGPGQGASFTIVLPAVRSHPSDASAESSSADLESAIKGRTVLLVEDDGDTLQALALTLQFEDIQVLTATSAEEAQPLIERTLPDAIVSDLTMSGASGCDLLQSIRARGITAPAIALSGHVRAEDEQMAKAAGFDDYLAKPVDPAKLIDALARLIKR